MTVETLNENHIVQSAKKYLQGYINDPSNRVKDKDNITLTSSGTEITIRVTGLQIDQKTRDFLIGEPEGYAPAAEKTILGQRFKNGIIPEGTHGSIISSVQPKAQLNRTSTQKLEELATVISDHVLLNGRSFDLENFKIENDISGHPVATATIHVGHMRHGDFGKQTEKGGHGNR